MQIGLSDRHKVVLKSAFYGCSCELYYSYQCTQCKAIAHGFLQEYKKEIKELKEFGLIKNGVQGGLNTTQSGVDAFFKYIGWNG